MWTCKLFFLSVGMHAPRSGRGASLYTTECYCLLPHTGGGQRRLGCRVYVSKEASALLFACALALILSRFFLFVALMLLRKIYVRERGICVPTVVVL